MVTEKELQAAIDKLETESSSYDRCMVLAALYALKDRYYGCDNAFSETFANASYNQAKPQLLSVSGDSEFLKAAEGKSWEEVLPLLDELMSAVKVLQPNLYAAVMRRLNQQNQGLTI